MVSTPTILLGNSFVSVEPPVTLEDCFSRVDGLDEFFLESLEIPRQSSFPNFSQTSLTLNRRNLKRKLLSVG